MKIGVLFFILISFKSYGQVINQKNTTGRNTVVVNNTAKEVLKEKTIFSNFATSIFVNRDSAQLLQDYEFASNNEKFSLPSSYYMYISVLLNEYKKSRFSKDHPNIKFPNDIAAFSELIEYRILELLFTYFNNSWLIDLVEHKTPIGTSYTFTRAPGIGKGVKMSWIQLMKENDSIFKTTNLNSITPFLDSINLPPTSKIKLSSDKNSFFTLFVDNKYSFLKIKIRLIYSGVGIGEIQTISKLSNQVSENFKTHTYAIDIEGGIKKEYSLSKEGRQCEKWINTIVKLLSENLDYQKYSSILKEWQTNRNSEQLDKISISQRKPEPIFSLCYNDEEKFKYSANIETGKLEIDVRFCCYNAPAEKINISYCTVVDISGQLFLVEDPQPSDKVKSFLKNYSLINGGAIDQTFIFSFSKENIQRINTFYLVLKGEYSGLNKKPYFEIYQWNVNNQFSSIKKSNYVSPITENKLKEYLKSVGVII